IAPRPSRFDDIVAAEPVEAPTPAPEIPTYEPQRVEVPEIPEPPAEMPRTYDYLFYKTGKTKEEREALNRPQAEAMQKPFVSPETAAARGRPIGAAMTCVRA